jgi:hypothetical protein
MSYMPGQRDAAAHLLQNDGYHEDFVQLTSSRIPIAPRRAVVTVALTSALFLNPVTAPLALADTSPADATSVQEGAGEETPSASDGSATGADAATSDSGTFVEATATASETASVATTEGTTTELVGMADASDTTDAQVPKDADYSLKHIAEDYTYYGKGDLEGYADGTAANHQVGPIAVGGDAHLSNVGSDAVQNEYSFVAGELTLDGNILTASAKDGTIVVGTRNEGKAYSGATTVAYDDDHIDFDAAFASIEEQVEAIVGDTEITWSELPVTGDAYWSSAEIPSGGY